LTERPYIPTLHQRWNIHTTALTPDEILIETIRTDTTMYLKCKNDVIYRIRDTILYQKLIDIYEEDIATNLVLAIVIDYYTRIVRKIITSNDSRSVWHTLFNLSHRDEIISNIDLSNEHNNKRIILFLNDDGDIILELELPFELLATKNE
jgi:hypothetical protein